MPRRPRTVIPGMPLHIVQRGNNKQVCFTCDQDIAVYANRLAEAAVSADVSIHAWVFMTNHVHLLATPGTEEGASKMMQSLGRRYVQYFNYSYARSGTLFEGRFNSTLVDENDYLITCMNYIELNPVRAGIVRDPGDYRWSSYQAHAFGKRMALWTPHAIYDSLGDDDKTRQSRYRSSIKDTIDIDVVAKIRHCTNTGLVLGSEKFRKQVEELRGESTPA